MRVLLPLACAFLLVTSLAAESRGRRYALILSDPPMARVAPDAKDLRTTASQDHLRKIQAAQSTLRQALADRGITVTGSTDTLLNAVYVAVREGDQASLGSLPGVARVEPMGAMKRHMVRAPELVRAAEAWNGLGGSDRAGSGVRIGILDTGIDNTHEAFRDAGYVRPAGFPKCQPADCAQFTNAKVIAARSYVRMLVLGDEPEFSRPDDLSPRDRVGHGTATAMVAAGVRHQTPLGIASGVAPGAFVGNYKIFGSPGVNDVTFDDVVIRAMEDALIDGMDVVVLALGRAALFAPDDRGAICGLPSGAPCDPRADAVESAVRRGLTVVVSAGNDGDLGIELPTLNSIHTPGTAESAITVGAITNRQLYYAGVIAEGAAVPANLRRVPALFGAVRPPAMLRAPMRDVAALGDNGRACSPLANGSLQRAIALIERGDCSFATKVNNASRAGAAGVVIYRSSGDFLFPPTGLAETAIPAALIGNTDGLALKAHLAAAPDQVVALDPTVAPSPIEPYVVAYFSSQGPNIGSSSIKPEIVAVGRQTYVATQSFDPNGDMFDASRYTAVEGTSFSAPMVAGGVALVKQANPGFTPAQLKSAVVNTANNDLDDFDYDDRLIAARVTGVGAGLLDAAAAVRTTVVVEPATISFGALTGAALPSRLLRIHNTGPSAANIAIQVQARNASAARVTATESNFALAPGANRQITVRLEGARPAPGAYEGDLVITGGAVPLRVPFLYLVGDNAAFNAFPLRGFGFAGNVGDRLPGRLALKVVDRHGVPVDRAPIRFRATLGGGRIDTANAATDELGIAEASIVFLGSQLGDQEFSAESGPLTVYFPGRARQVPVIRTGGAVNAASGLVGRGNAPGSYMSIFGRALSEVTKVAFTSSLPLSLAQVSVSFDDPTRAISLPGRLHFVSDGQINVQIPWELQGLNTIIMKVSIGDTSSALYDVPLNDYSPGVFEYDEASTGRRLAVAQEGGALIGSGRPAGRDRVIVLYVNGLGPVDNTPESGEPSPAQPLARTRVLPVVMFGGREGEVSFAGLTPFFVGLYQINVRVPADAPAGLQPVVVTINGVSSKPVNLPIQ
jgi:minor extracellular serine protease Vpr